MYEREATIRVDDEHESVEGDERGHPGGDVKSEAAEKGEHATAEVGTSGERVAEEAVGASEEHGDEKENDVDERLTRAQEAHVGAFVERRRRGEDEEREQVEGHAHACRYDHKVFVHVLCGSNVKRRRQRRNRQG